MIAWKETQIYPAVYNTVTVGFDIRLEYPHSLTLTLSPLFLVTGPPIKAANTLANTKTTYTVHIHFHTQPQSTCFTSLKIYK